MSKDYKISDIKKLKDLEGNTSKYKVEVKTNTYFRELYIDDYADVLKKEEKFKSYLIKHYKG